MDQRTNLASLLHADPPRSTRRLPARGKRGVRFSVGVASLATLLALGLGGCADREHQIVVSIPEQRMVVLKQGVPLTLYPVSTSRFGLGDQPGTNGTPLGNLEIAQKIGGGAPLGMKFKSRVATGEIVPVDAPGRDPVVTRILWLRGREEQNRQAYNRYIYIHGTPEERNIGRPASYGCVRMRSADVAALYEEVSRGARVFIANRPLAEASAPFLAAGASVPPLAPLPAFVEPNVSAVTGR